MDNLLFPKFVSTYDHIVPRLMITPGLERRDMEIIEVKTRSEVVFQCSKPRICGGIISRMEVFLFMDAAIVQHDHLQGPYADGS